MAASGREDSGLESQSSSVECMPSSQHCPSSDSLPEWRSSEQVENGTPSTPPPYWDTDEDDDPGSRPSDLFGKYTWKIDDFSQINKRELRSNIFEIGGYKWYILIYPQGCDVCNHLSLFLCVANHDKLLPGWSHFAQFTIAVVNKDSKKSKYSDTLHRFWKKEHDWGWKKFMELSKVSDGFLVDDALVIKAQVQVIREKTDRPFRCLDWQYRRELVRVYLSNVEQLCRRFVEEKRGKFSKMLEDKVRWSSFHTFWSGVEQNARRRMSRDKSETILKVVVKHFFIENEVTSTLVMDYLYSGLKILECQSKSKKGRAKLLEMEEMRAPFVRVEKDIFVLTDDVLLLLQRAASEPLPPKDEKSSQNQNRMKEGNCGEELGKDSIERDERRLTELGRRTVEIFALNHIFSRIEVAYQEAVALRRQEELIREEEAAGQAENELKSKRNAAEKEKRTKKKQTKPKKGTRKGKDRGRDEKHDITEKKVQVENNCRERVLEEFKENSSLPVLEKVKTSADVSDMSDIGEDIVETLQLELEERDSSPISWDTDASEIHPPVNTELQKERADKKTLCVMDDSSSTCSTDSVPSVVMNGPSRVNASSNSKKSSSRSRGKNQRSRCTIDQNDPAYNDTDKLQADTSVVDTSRLSDVTGSCRGTASESEAVSLSASDCMPQLERHPLKEEEVVSLQRKPSNNDQVDVDGPFRSVTAERSSPSRSIKSPSICERSKPTSERSIIVADPVTIMESSSNSRCLTEKLVPTVTRSPLISKQEAKSTVDAKTNTAHRVSVESRPSSAPLVPAIRPTTSLTSTAPSVPLLSRSASAAGRLGVDPSPSTQSNVIQSYRNAIIAGKTTVDTNAPSFTLRTSSCSSSQTSAFSSSPPSIISSASTLPLLKPAIVERTSGRPGLTFGSVNPEALRSQCLWTQEFSQVDATSSIVNNHNFLCDDVGPYVGGSCHRTYCLDEVSSGLSVHHIQGLGATQDEFPHLDIINDLLNEEHGIGEVAANGYYHPPHHNLNQQYTFLDDASTAAVDVMSNDGCHFDQLDQYYDDRLQRVYGCSNGPLDGRRGLTSTPLDLSAYMNGQIGGVIQNQWPLSIADHSVLSLGSAEANGYAFHLPDYSNLACGLNGYNMYRPANGH